MRKILSGLTGTLLLIYLGLYFYFYFIQDNRFESVRLSQDFVFTSEGNFEEFYFTSKDGGKINSLLFTTDSSRGVICFWKGNGGNMEKWAHVAPLFLKTGYDIVVTDYREHGKSRGEITMDNFYADAQMVYDFLKTQYSESRIIVVGYSLGASIASHLSRTNEPAKTILVDPRARFENKYLEALFFPLPAINRFPFRTDLDIQETKTPVYIITGTSSRVYKDAQELKMLLNGNDRYYEIEGATHESILGDIQLERIVRSLLHD